MRWSAIAQAVGFMVGPIGFLLLSPRLVFRVESIINIGLIYWILLDLIQGRYGLDDTREDSVSAAVFSLGLFATGVWVGSLVRTPRLPMFVTQTSQLSIGPRSLLGFGTICFILSMAHYVYSCDFDIVLLIESLSKERTDTPWLKFRLSGQYTGSWIAILEQLGNFGLVLPSLAVVSGRLCGFLSFKTFLLLLFSAVFLAFIFQGGSRRILGLALGASIANYLLLVDRISPRLFLKAALAIVILLFLLELTLAARSSGQGVSAVQSYNPTFDEGMTIRVDDNFLRLTQVIWIFQESDNYLYFNRVWFMVTRPIPRVLWPGKPDLRFDLASSLGFAGVSFSASAVADGYMAFGNVGVFMFGFVFGLLGVMWNQLLYLKVNPCTAITYGLGLMMFFVGIRSVDDCVFSSYPLIGWLALSNVALSLQKTKSL